MSDVHHPSTDAATVGAASSDSQRADEPEVPGNGIDFDPESPNVAPSRHQRSRWQRMWRGRYRWWTRAAAVILVLLLALVVDGIVLNLRISHVEVAMPSGGGGATYLIVGSDSRADLPTGASTASFGSSTDVAGARADVVLLVHRSDNGSVSTVSVPRDLLIDRPDKAPLRLALTFSSGAQDAVDGLCRTLGVRVDHVVVINFDSFTAVVDTLGGVQIDLAAPTRDTVTGLDLPKAGRQTLNGTQALALVRSRQPQQLIAGRWTPVPDGSAQRTYWAGTIFASLRQTASQVWHHPLTLQLLAWRATGSLTTDSETGIFDLASLARSAGSPVDLPTRQPDTATLPVEADDQTFAALARAGFDRQCQVTK